MPVVLVAPILVGAIALFALLTLPFLKLLVDRGVPNVPLIGGAIRDALKSGLDAIYSGLHTVLDDAAVPVALLVNGIALTLWWLTYFVVSGITAGIVYANQAIRLAEDLYNQAVAYTVTIANQVLGAVYTLVHQVYQYADSLYGQAVGVAEALYNQAVGVAEALYNRAIGYADQIGAQARAYAVTVAQGVLGALYTLYGQAVAHADSLFGQAEAEIRALGADVINTATQTLGEAETFATTAAGTAAAAAAAGVLAQVIPRVLTLEADAAECLRPLCETVTPNAKILGDLGKLLTGLENVGLAGLLAALVAEAVHDPKAAAGDVETVGGWVTGTAKELIGAVVG